MAEIIVIPLLTDNYGYLMHDAASEVTLAVDPSEAGPVQTELKRRDWSLTAILCTHHHADHIGGVPELKAAYGCRIYASRYDQNRIPAVTDAVGEGDVITLGGLSARVLEIPGHTHGHVAYWFEGEQAVFCGDTLFSMAVGKLFEGTYAQLWASLNRLRALPPQTRVYCGHEYTINGCAFAEWLEPDNAALKARNAEIRALRAEGKPTIPSTIGTEAACNPNLRWDSPVILQKLGMDGQDPIAAFTKIREMRYAFG